MPTHIAIGASQAADPQEAAYQACMAAKNSLNSAQTDLVLLFTGENYARDEVLNVIHTILRPKRLTGACAGAIIAPDGILKNGLVLLAVNSDDISFGLAAVNTPPSADLRQAGFELGRKLTGDFGSPGRQAGLIFTDGI
ncbi:MAG TPA: FIST N-terminal domain-containing protein, partial [Candidatus Omnitrophota bacterium]|nr:FIST N-terminal domain-containing protein [Candidatus Omnitrophota bacterium]